MRKDDHQSISEYFVGTFKKGVKYDAEGTGLGWENTATILARTSISPTLQDETSERSLTDIPAARFQMEAGVALCGWALCYGSLVVSLLNGLVYGMLCSCRERADAHPQHDGRAQLRACQRLHAGRLFRRTTISVYIGFGGAGHRSPACGLIGAAIEMFGLRRGPHATATSPNCVHLRLALLIEKGGR